MSYGVIVLSFSQLDLVGMAGVAHGEERESFYRVNRQSNDCIIS